MGTITFSCSTNGWTFAVKLDYSVFYLKTKMFLVE
jgi:hypothetical protein